MIRANLIFCIYFLQITEAFHNLIEST